MIIKIFNEFHEIIQLQTKRELFNAIWGKKNSDTKIYIWLHLEITSSSKQLSRKSIARNLHQNVIRSHKIYIHPLRHFHQWNGWQSWKQTMKLSKRATTLWWLDKTRAAVAVLSMLLEKLHRRHAIERITWEKKSLVVFGKGDSLNHLFARPLA